MNPPVGGIAICCDGGSTKQAEQLAAESGWPLQSHPQDLTLLVTAGKLVLRDRLGGWDYACDFVDGPFGYRRQTSRKEPLVRAVGGEGRDVVDATGGFGRDAALLALAGCRVRVFERHPIVAAMLRDGLRRAAQLKTELRVLGEIEVTSTDAIAALKSLSDAPQVVYLDPMFPQAPHGAQVRKASQALRRLVHQAEGASDENQLWTAAAQIALERVVVKRPIHAPPIGSTAPASTLEQKTIRFDVYPR
jgi:16S rRNA (guanine1516-N2)-methyltransferase